MSQFHLLRIPRAVIAPVGALALAVPVVAVAEARYPTHKADEALTAIGTARSAASVA